jgi:hypothetical protein
MSERFPVCACPSPTPDLAEHGRVWVCKRCGNLTHDPTLESQIVSLLGRIDQRVAAEIEARLGQLEPDAQGVLTAEEVQARTGLSYYQVRDRRDELGCVSRPGAPLKFSAARVAAFLRGEVAPAPPPDPTRARPRKRKAQVPLLPIKGEEAA